MGVQVVSRGLPIQIHDLRIVRPIRGRSAQYTTAVILHDAPKDLNTDGPLDTSSLARFHKNQSRP